MSKDFALTREDKEQLVLDLYRQGKRNREIAKIARMSFTDIKIIIDREYGTKQEKNKVKAELSNYSQALKMFSGGAKPITVAIRLGLTYEEVRQIFMQFLSLNRMFRLKQIYDELGLNIKTFLRLYNRMQEENFDMEQITEVINFAGSLPELQAMHSTLSNRIQELELEIQNLTSSAQQLELEIQDAKYRLEYYNHEDQNKEKQISALNSAIDRKKRFIQRIDDSEGYSRIKEAANKEGESLLQNHHALLTLVVSVVLESIKRYPANHQLIYELSFGSATPNPPMMELHKNQLLQLSKYIHSEILARITRITTDELENTIAG
jgi:hypothetical protein